ncbi:MAG: DUF2130 domain-containing protein [Candidatus Berkelbacteria bacterium]|nr:DUF2130 domain-containing protein [Candidatus Berkelbacteria bacterium]
MSEQQTPNYKCPLCKSILSKERWIRITGQWDEQQKSALEAKKQIQDLKKREEEREKKYKQDTKKISKAASEAGFKRGQEKEKNERTRMSKLLEKRTRDIQIYGKKIQELEKQLKEGKTPQTAGFDYEKEVIAMLNETFTEDNIKPTGKRGDAIQEIVFDNKVIGSILYECKKTSEYKNSFTDEIKRHKEEAKADYGVIVTHAIKNGKTNFFIEDEIIIVGPLCMLDVANWLRGAIIEMYKLKLTGEKYQETGRAILKYMQSGEFKIHMSDSAKKAEEAYSLMVQEINSHKKTWQERYRLYSAIHNNVQTVRLEIGKIITGNPELGRETLAFPEIPENLE